MVAAQIGVAMSDVERRRRHLMVQGAGVGAQLVSTKYGRDAELESDLYGMRYMQRAGYDPQGAVTLQEKFVRLPAGRRPELAGGPVRHPPAVPERVGAEPGDRSPNSAAAAISARSATRRASQAAARDEARLRQGRPGAGAAAQEGRHRRSEARSPKPRSCSPRKAGSTSCGRDRAGAEGAEGARAVLREGDRAESDYFGSYLGAGVAEYRAGDKAKAEQ